jgi:uncharacterized membrane protein
MKRRPRRSLPAAIVTLLVLGVCVVVAITEIETLVGYPPLVPFPRAASYGQGLRFSDLPVIIAGSVAAAVGLILLICGLVPGKHTVLPLSRTETETPRVDSAGVTRRRLAAALRFTLVETDGVAKVRTKLTRRKLKAKVKTERRDPEAVHTACREALERSLALAALAKTPRLRLRVRSTRRKRAA